MYLHVFIVATNCEEKKNNLKPPSEGFTVKLIQIFKFL